jgi:hypothetical protein
MSEDISPATKPFQTRVEQLAADVTTLNTGAAHDVHGYIDLAKRSLLEHRVRDFTAADVVALAALMEQRDRALREGNK